MAEYEEEEVYLSLQMEPVEMLRVTHVRVRPPASSGAAPYWETELLQHRRSDVLPSTAFYYDYRLLKVLARSRDGLFMACMGEPGMSGPATPLSYGHSRKFERCLLVFRKGEANEPWSVASSPSQDEELPLRAGAAGADANARCGWTLVRKIRLPCSSKARISPKKGEDEEQEIAETVILTDEAYGAELELTVEDEQAIFAFGAQRTMRMQIPPATVLFTTRQDARVRYVRLLRADGSMLRKKRRYCPEHAAGVAHYHHRRNRSKVQAQALESYMKLHVQERRTALAQALQQFQAQSAMGREYYEPVDFTLTLCTDHARYPSLMSVIKRAGRPSFSVDKRPRLVRAAQLCLSDEIEGIFTLFAILRNMMLPPERWTVCAQTQQLFALSPIYTVLSTQRTDHSALVKQLRRWLPYCKLLAREHSMASPAVASSSYCLKEHWINTRGRELSLRIQDWLQRGEPPQDVLGQSCPYQTMRQWMDAHLHSTLTTPPPYQQQQQPPCAPSMDDEYPTAANAARYALLPSSPTSVPAVCASGIGPFSERDDLLYMDEARKGLLTSVVSAAMCERTDEEPRRSACFSPLRSPPRRLHAVQTKGSRAGLEHKTDKIQRCFEVSLHFAAVCAVRACLSASVCPQHLAQDFSALVRDYKMLVMLCDKIDTVFMRMHCAEKDMDKRLEDICAMLPDGRSNPLFADLHAFFQRRLEEIEQQHCVEMRENLEPSSTFVQRKHKIREAIAFLQAFGEFLNEQQ